MNRFSSIFSQLLQLFPRLEFYRMVKETKAEHHARGLTRALRGSCLNRVASLPLTFEG